MKYIKGKGFFVGQFNEEDLKYKRDKVAVEKAKAETGFNIFKENSPASIGSGMNP